MSKLPNPTVLDRHGDRKNSWHIKDLGNGIESWSRDTCLELGCEPGVELKNESELVLAVCKFIGE